MIKHEFVNAVGIYTNDGGVHLKMWNELEKNYSSAGRHYHNLSHLNSMLNELLPYKTKFESWDVIVFAIAYHDFVYNASRSDNEEQSAGVAYDKLTGISFPETLTDFCKKLILATKKHEPSGPEIDLFTDADLSILGSPTGTYKEYSRQIRREYSIYPDFLYVPGRIKVLKHFLDMPNIYKTGEFRDRLEDRAKLNLRNELISLSKNE